ncbi:MAG: metal-dependent hydrolase [Candidatus Gastranaerophilales bacterium]|nr:metal-dependent hydrolase [Candidatus Gastranaerophilales bacterium]
MTFKITYFGHSAFEIETPQGSILIDPFLSQNPHFKGDISKIRPVDILLTHAHSDHTGDAIPIAKSTGATITAIFELALYCQKKGANVNPVNTGGTLNFDWGTALFLPANHSSSTPEGDYGGIATSILLEIQGKKIYHAGDTGLSAELKMVGELFAPDICMLPIGGHFTLGQKEALQAAKWLNAGEIIPMHYDTFAPIKTDVNDFKFKIESETNSKCRIIKPHESLTY